MKNLDKYIRRIDKNRVSVINPYGIDVTLIANEDVPIELDGIKQLLGFLSLQETIDQLHNSNFFGNKEARIAQVVVTPDFHKGGGIPIGTVADARGFVIPSAVGNDVCCGMRLLVTDVTADELRPHLERLEPRLRAIYFGGERDIPMSPAQRKALLSDGLLGVHQKFMDNYDKGLWKYYYPDTEYKDLARVHFNGSFPVDESALEDFKDFIQGSGANDSRDSQIGSIGGGNHFVEFQTVEDIYDGAAAYDWGVTKNTVTIMAHTGSVGLGHAVGLTYNEAAKKLYPSNFKHPDHDFYMLPTDGKNAHVAKRYLNAMQLAANFAFGNRLFLGLMAARAMSEVLGRHVMTRLVYDAPHNLIWSDMPGQRFLHRKGACPALGMAHAEGTPFEYYGVPVIIPGSMGASSFLLAGEGNEDLLSSACHGAGRSLTRGQTQHVGEDEYVKAMEPLRVVSPIDPKLPSIASRRDILAKYHSRLKEEAPYAYKPITPIIDSVEGAGVARKVARLWPLLTVKG